MTKKPSEEARAQYRSKIRLSQMIGCNFSDGKILNPLLIFVMIMGALEQVMHFNGLYLSWPDIPQICNSAAIYCLVLQLLVRLATKFLRDDQGRIIALMDTIITFYEREEQVHKYRKILNDYMKTAKYLLNGFLILWLGMICVPNPTAWILSWYTGEFTLFIPIVLPFTDPNTLNGYIINSALIVFYTALVYVCFMCGDVFYFFFVYQSFPMVNIYCLKMEEFGEKLVKVKAETIKSSKPEIVGQKNVKPNGDQISRIRLEAKRLGEIAKVEHELIDLIEEFNTYHAYIRSTVAFMEPTHFAALALDSMGIAMSTIVMLTYSKIMGFIVVSFMVVEMLIPCILGTLLTHQKEKLLNELFGFKWYELSLEKQKIFLQFIHLCQNSNEFVVPIIGKINIELFTSAMNGTYSYLMYLLNFVKLV